MSACGLTPLSGSVSANIENETYTQAELMSRSCRERTFYSKTIKNYFQRYLQKQISGKAIHEKMLENPLVSLRV